MGRAKRGAGDTSGKLNRRERYIYIHSGNIVALCHENNGGSGGSNKEVRSKMHALVIAILVACTLSL